MNLAFDINAAFLGTTPRKPTLPTYRPVRSRAFDRLHDTFAVWRHRIRSRGQLAELDQHLLDDIGLTSTQARLESGKFFWQR